MEGVREEAVRRYRAARAKARLYGFYGADSSFNELVRVVGRIHPATPASTWVAIAEDMAEAFKEDKDKSLSYPFPETETFSRYAEEVRERCMEIADLRAHEEEMSTCPF